MATVVLFHSALGLRPAVHDFADALRAAGHEVHTPDYYDGETFDTVEEGVVKRDALGQAEIARRAQAAVEGLPADLVYAGFSLGAAAAQVLAQTRPGARGAALMHGCLPTEAVGAPWPAGLPVEIHTHEADPWCDAAEARAVAAETGGTAYVYPGDSHLFADAGLPDHDPEAAALMLARVIAFLDRVGAD
ncbi:dienelactone hydrolase family protein [Georgenia thermotolerans]|uniref:Dienelactone hydrolase n=1 Tax=Georgenia thermotolerans TaxID=527326 RepID=A0A7J5UIT6_9MICO|nr:dienelactone hydrolase family protein [Georgenia thermotolerans]KAE8762277.1 dienelactone hydrolase [Georgenia thermotolerans]